MSRRVLEFHSASFGLGSEGPPPGLLDPSDPRCHSLLPSSEPLASERGRRRCAAAARYAVRLTALSALGVSLAVVTFTATGTTIEGDARLPRVTNRCPANARPLRSTDLPALRRFALKLAPHGVQKAGSRSIDYRDATPKAKFPTFYTSYVRSVCSAPLVKRVIARTADVAVGYPHVNWSASLSYSVFLIVRVPHGFVGWAQMH
jgi:hypothetical protein